MPVDIRRLAADLTAETAALEQIVGGIDDLSWNAPTPAIGWSVRDQIAHLAYFDEATVLAIRDSDCFRNEALATLANGDDFVERNTADYRHVSNGHVWIWFHALRRELVETVEDAYPGLRVPWYGPGMSVASAVTARIMETWAHGQDIADALGVAHEPTDRLRHVADLGVRTIGFSFALRGRPIPTVPIRVELKAPDGERWAWGPADANDIVRGDALDFCLAVTQRRHRDDLGLSVTGSVANDWMTIAQAYAGPVGSGRRAKPSDATDGHCPQVSRTSRLAPTSEETL